MPNANYLKGRRFEYERAKHYREVMGSKAVLRTAGSHGLFDLVVVTRHGHVDLIQCKSVATKTEALRMIENFRKEPPLPIGYHDDYHQVLAVKIKGGEILEATV